MNYLKLQTDILKALDKEKTRNIVSQYRYALCSTADDIKYVIIFNKYSAIYIRSDLFFLDLDKVSSSPVTLKNNFFNEDNTIPTVTEGLTMPLQGTKKRLQIFNNANCEIAVDVDLLKYFDLENATFRASNEKSPVFIYENYILVGVVLPVVRKKEKR